MTAPTPELGHELTATVEGRVVVYRCACGQFAYATSLTTPDPDRVAMWHADHVKEMADEPRE